MDPPDFPSLEDIPVTTMVVIVGFTPPVDIDLLFPLLDMARLKRPIVKNSKKVSLPLLRSGSLLSARYKGIVLGDVHFPYPRFFKNSITVDVSTSKKNINVKISKGNLQMCGIKSIDMAEETASLIFSHIRKAEALLSRIREEHLDTAKDYVARPQEEDILLGADKEILGRLVYYATKCSEMEQFVEMIEKLRSNIKKIPRVVGTGHEVSLLSLKGPPSPLAMATIRKAMVNYNFSLGFKINRGELATRINGVQEFKARYNNTLDYSVTIEHPHDLVVNRKKESPRVTFTVYKSGILTISGPNREIIETIYEKFVGIIREIRPFIELAY